MKTLGRIAVILLLMVFLVYIIHPYFLEALANYLVVQDKLEKADIILVLAGDSNGERVAQAVDLYKNGYAPKILMSGGPVMWGETYAENMKRQALFLGVPGKDILLQDRSESTYEDAKYSAETLRNKGMRTIILVTSPFHMRRALRTVKRQFGADFKIIAYPVQTSRYQTKDWWKRHEDTQVIVWELEALIFYSLKGI